MTAAKILFRLLCAGILGAAVLQVTTRAYATAEPLESVDSKRASLEARERELQSYERRLAEREQDVDAKLKEMERLRAAVSGELEAQKKGGEERIAKMVQVFETMSPKPAAGVMETLDEWLAIEVLKRMDVKRVAKIMNLMDKTRSAKLSELLTGFYRPDAERAISSVKTAGQAKAEQVSVAPKQENPTKKGGERENDKHITGSR